jgi:hypothetical protein
MILPCIKPTLGLVPDDIRENFSCEENGAVSSRLEVAWVDWTELANS